MTLLLTLFAAIVSTVVWYMHAPADTMKIKYLCFMYWGASLMWLADAVFEYAELKAAFFTPDPADMLNDAYLGFSVIALALVIWLAVLLIKDPKGIVKAALFKKNDNA